MKKILPLLIKFFTYNLGTKIMAVVLAGIIWFYFNYEYPDVLPEPLTIPLKLSLPPNIITTHIETPDGIPINQVKVILQGPRDLLNDIPPDILCLHKITGADASLNKPMVRTEEIMTGDFINLPPQIRIKSFEPAKIIVTIVKEDSKVMRIKTDDCLQGSVAEGYRITRIKASPSEILVRGPKNILDNYNEIVPRKINISGRTASFSQEGHIPDVLDGQKITMDDKFIVEVTIQDILVEKIFKSNINVLLPAEFPYKVKINPEQVDLKLKLPQSVIDKFNEHHFNLFINVTSLYSQISDVKAGMTYNPSVEFRLTPDAPGRDRIEEPKNLPQIKLDVLEQQIPPPPAPPPPEQK
ncbi:MAG: YbbR-like domain-containing protein [Planctomycetota bacterium]